MTDRRLTPANGRVAATYLRGQVEAEVFTDGVKGHVRHALVDLLDRPHGARERQLLAGTPVTVYETRDHWCFIQSGLDGYVGYVGATGISYDWNPTHMVHSRGTHSYRHPDLKSYEGCELSLGTQLPVEEVTNNFARTPLGYVPAQHLSPIGKVFDNPLKIAELFLHTPYLWGGNSWVGIDCSGLVQIALTVCGMPCPADSDLQEKSVGKLLPEGTPPEAGDLFFWPGHVAMVTDQDRIIHANAHHMAVEYEGIKEAINRIGPVRSHRRP